MLILSVEIVCLSIDLNGKNGKPHYSLFFLPWPAIKRLSPEVNLIMTPAPSKNQLSYPASLKGTICLYKVCAETKFIKKNEHPFAQLYTQTRSRSCTFRLLMSRKR